ncbi:MAG: glucose-6-phosphate isomerase [Nitrospinota bacterium]
MKNIELDYTNLMAPRIGTKHGICHTDIARLLPQAKIHARKLAKHRKEGMLPFFDLPFATKESQTIISDVKKLKKEFDTIVILGIGGSALGTIALVDALLPSTHNILPSSKRSGMKIVVLDNIDPDHFTESIKALNLKKTLFNVISKSGSTSETAAQFLIIVEMLKEKIGPRWRKHLVVTTDKKIGSLRKLALKNRFKSYAVPDNVGGRFTLLSPVCLFPAACAGIDIMKLLEGAQSMSTNISATRPDKYIGYMLAMLTYLLDTKKSKKMLVMMPYSSKLFRVADWFRQLWAESLGKKRNLNGKNIYNGQTPINGLGATDQHSQMQLYVEGPFDKVILFIKINQFENTVSIPNLYTDYSSFGYLNGQSLNNLITVEQAGSQYALTKNRRPNMTLTIDKVNPHSIGALLYMLETATAFAGNLYNVNTFDQPGVEFGKNYTYARLNRIGYESQSKKLHNLIEQDSDEFLI